MAIIYTYPRLLDPDGTELIVVSETKNQNATRLLTVGAIVELFDCSHCDYCEDAIYSIIPPVGEEVVADGCDQINFTSSDASVTITGTDATKTLDFVAVGGGGGGCPQEYVIKPVCCEGEGECILQEEVDQWFFTCDETLGALAPGYISGLQFNGAPVNHPCGDPNDCWWIEALTITATSTDCATCCPGDPEQIYKLTPCDQTLQTYWTDDSNSIGPAGTTISNYDGSTIIATTGQVTECYQVSKEVGVVSFVTIVQSYPGCDCCQNYPYNVTYKECISGAVHSITLTPVQLADILLNGPASTWYTIRIQVGEEYVCAYFADMSCQEDDGVTWDNSPADCNDGVYCPQEYILLEPCDNNDQPYTTDITTDETESPTLAGVSDGELISLNTGTGAIACYIVTRPATGPLDGGPVTMEYQYYPETQCVCCESQIREYQECGGGATVFFDLSDPLWGGAFAPNVQYPCLKGELVTEEYTCYEFVQCPDDPGGITTPLTLVDNSPQCCEDDDCQAENTLRYTQCNEGGQDPPASMLQHLYFIDNGSMPTHIIVSKTVGLALSWCYYLDDDAANLPEDPDYIWVEKDPLACTPCQVYEYHSCADPGTPLYTANGDIMNAPYDSGAWADTEADCYETVGEVDLQVAGGGLNLQPIVPDLSYVDCDCCDNDPQYNDMHQYLLCSTYDPAPALAPPSIVLDLSAVSPLYPDIVSVDIGSGIFVCYEYDTPVCLTETHATYIAGYDDCEMCEEAHTDPYVIEVRDCSDVATYFVEYQYFNPDPSTLNPGEIIEVTSGALYDSGFNCWEIIDMNSATPPNLTDPMNEWNGPYADNPPNEQSECDCCDNKFYEYTRCDPHSCSVSSLATIIVDHGPGGSNLWPTIPNFILAHETASGGDYECCYENPERTCDDVTGVYDQDVQDCNDVACDII